MATLLDIIQSAIEGIGEHEVPSEIATSSDDLAKQLKSLANDVGLMLALEYDFQEVLSEHSFETVADTALYDLPSGFKSVEPETFWDETEEELIVGPLANKEFNLYKKGVITLVGSVSIFRIIGNKIEIYPTPSSVRTLSFDYYSLNWVYDTDGTTDKAEYLADTDTCRFDDMLFKLAMKVAFLEAHGEDTQIAQAAFNRYLGVRAGVTRSQGSLRFIRRSNDEYGNLPDGNYGS